MGKKKNGKKGGGNGGHKRQWSLPAEVDPILIPEGQRQQQQPDGRLLSGSNGGPVDSSPLTSLPRRISGRFTGNGSSPGAPLVLPASLPRAIPISYSQHQQNHHSRTLSESRQSGLKIFNNFSPNTFHAHSLIAGNNNNGRPAASSFRPILNAGRSPSASLGYSYGATPQGEEGPLTEEQVARILSGHLVQKEAGEQPSDFGTVSHSLLGGKICAYSTQILSMLTLTRGNNEGYLPVGREEELNY